MAGHKYKTNVKKQKKASTSKRSTASLVCPKRTSGKFCKYCAKVDELRNNYDEHKDIISKTQAKSTFYMGIVDHKDKDAGPQVYACGIENWRTLIDFLPDEDGDGADFTDPDAMIPIIITRRGTGINTDYTIKLSTKEVKCKTSWLKSMPKLHNIVELLENDEVPVWKPAEGKNTILIFPPWGKEADGDFYKEVFFHWNTSLLDALIDGGDEDEDEDEGDGGDYKDGEFEDVGDGEDDDLEDMTIKQLTKLAKGLGIKKIKDMDEDELIEAIEEAREKIGDNSGGDAEDLEDLTAKELKKIAKDLGIKKIKDMDDDELIEAIEEAREEAGEGEGEEDLEDLTSKELKKIAKDLDIKKTAKMDDDELIEAIEEAREEASEDADDKFTDMDRKELVKFIKKNKLKIKTAGEDAETLRDELRDLEDDIVY